jgi:hypothetical protein
MGYTSPDKDLCGARAEMFIKASRAPDAMPTPTQGNIPGLAWPNW